MREAKGESGGGLRRRASLLCAVALPVLLGFYLLIVGYWGRPLSPGRELRLDEYLALVAKKQVHAATILAVDERIVGTYDWGEYWLDFSGGHESLFARLAGALEQAGVPTKIDRQGMKRAIAPASAILPALIVLDGLALIFLLVRGGADPGSFGRARARRGDGLASITFHDVAGVGEAIEELAEIRDYLADPGRFGAMGAVVPKGVLLDGPPGVGKTRLARALAGEASVPFFSISGSDFVEMYVGIGAARIRDLFATARQDAPAIVFIDELDAVGRARTAVSTGGSDEREASLNQLLVEMDGFEAASGVVVIAATNRPDVLDPALLRPGRFDRRIAVDLPDVVGREEILALHARGKPLDPDVDLAALARRTPGFSGADLANVLNEAALLATRRRSSIIGPAQLVEAIERVVAGPQRPSRVLSPEDKRRIAYHEAGHAVAAAALHGVGRVGKVSVIARGHAGGFTWYQSEDEHVLATRSQLLDRITALLGGRLAEELAFGESSTSASDDLKRAGGIARRMASQFGMSGLGPLSVAPDHGADDSVGPSQRLLGDVDAEVQAILAGAETRTRAILEANGAVLAGMAEELVVTESLEGAALEAWLGGVAPASGPEAAALPAGPGGGTRSAALAPAAALLRSGTC